MIFWKYSKSQRVMLLLLHKGTGTSFTTEKHKQLTFISVWIMSGTVLCLLVRWDFFRGFKTTNWACFAWFSETMKGHYSSFPFWFKYKIKTLIPHSSCLWNSSLIAAWTNRFTPLASIIMRGMTITGNAGEETCVSQSGRFLESVKALQVSYRK